MKIIDIVMQIIMQQLVAVDLLMYNTSLFEIDVTENMSLLNYFNNLTIICDFFFIPNDNISNN